MTVALYKLATQESREEHSGLDVYTIDEKPFIFLVADEEDVDELIDDGWFLTTTEAGAEPDELADDNEDELRAEYVEKLTKAGVSFHPNTGLAKLKAKVDELDQKTAS